MEQLFCASTIGNLYMNISDTFSYLYFILIYRGLGRRLLLIWWNNAEHISREWYTLLTRLRKPTNFLPHYSCFSFRSSLFYEKPQEASSDADDYFGIAVDWISIAIAFAIL